MKEVETGSSDVSTLQSELDSCKDELSSTKKKTEDLTKAKTSAIERIKKLKEKLEDSQHEAKRSRKKMKSAEKKKKLLKEEIKTKDQQLIEVEDRATFVENEVEVQRRLFVRKFLALTMDKTSTKTFAQITEVLEAAKSQPDNQQERHARYTRMVEKVQATYEDLAHTIMQQIEDLREIVDPLKDLELKTKEEYQDEENTSMNIEGHLQKEFQTLGEYFVRLDSLRLGKGGYIEDFARNYQGRSDQSIGCSLREWLRLGVFEMEMATRLT
ncbi:hypothetical protein R1sor_000785 [Riccia sorocarpa]|uniref:Uncharacterized protein n=1 Tax=Riccia sorocarpa TaxID=122646 RepID=A0ABD3GUY8_9MARC